MKRRLLIVGMAAVSVLSAQTSGGAGGGTGGTGGGGNPGGGTTTPGGGGLGNSRPTNPFPTQQDPGLNQPQMPQTIFLSGKVVLEDGTAPAEPVTIEKVCGGQPRPQGYTDSRGRFSFQLDQKNSGVLPDASSSSGTGDSFGDVFGGNTSMRGVGSSGRSMGQAGGRVMLMGCELRATLAGYQSSIVQLSNRNPLDNPDVGTIILKRLGNREGNIFSVTNALAPKDAKKALEKSRELAKKGKLDDAHKELTKAVELYPKYSSAWYEMGRILEEKGNKDEARKSYEQSIAADPKYVQPYPKLLMLAVGEQKWEEAANISAQLLKLNPFDYPQGYYYNAIANFQIKKFDEAEKSAKVLYEQDPKRFSRAGYIWGLVLARKDDFPTASLRLKKYLEDTPNAPDQDLVKKQLAEIDKMASGNQQ